MIEGLACPSPIDQPASVCEHFVMRYLILCVAMALPSSLVCAQDDGLPRVSYPALTTYALHPSDFVPSGWRTVAIKTGDLLVTSSTPGFAMRSTPVDMGGTPIHRPGTLIGKALEPMENGQGEILVLLMLQ